MLLIFKWLILLPVVMLLNRIRGGGMSNFTDTLPGRALYYVSFLIGGFLFILTNSVVFSVIGMLGFAIAMAPGWGLWFFGGDMSDDPRNKDPFNRVVNFLSFGNNWVAMFWRMFLCSWPLFGALFMAGFIPLITAVLFWIGFSGLFACIYAIRYLTGWHNMYAEFAVGALWWVIFGLIVI